MGEDRPSNKLLNSTVLIVEDNEDLLEMILDIFSDYNIKCIGAENGVEALTKLHDNHVDIILSDVRMPKMDGVGLLNEINSLYNGMPPLIFLTGFADYSDEYLLDLGAKLVLKKPTDMDEIVKEIDRVLQESTPPKSVL